ncbi:p45/48 [Oxyplax ochracea nucleopolyhedrovirus]|uniref:p45/48 n=1 Tax=Oxyplax ochracea nucleopolyhedrovirus TaxID=2083176 RepID=A0A2L0WU13_9ABAC|nr:p45/48 [Oxyplax ochracea nucleopolyhedrovirus]AVA31139.1 p45/48 [Oxyplax ochracea nucleopolyhedrovirus]
MSTYQLFYNLRFNVIKDNKYECKHYTFEANLSISEIDSLCFLFTKYFDQNESLDIKGLTFFTEYKKCIDKIKNSFEKQSDSEQVYDIKNIFSIFLREEFVKQVPHFQIIIKYLKQFYKPLVCPDINGIMCVNCAQSNKITCFECKCKYLSNSLSTLDVGLQNGWDIFLRPMLGLPLLAYVLFNTDFKNERDIVNENNLITHAFVQFFYNVLCDKASLHLKRESCTTFIKECKKVTSLLQKEDQERLLCILNSQCNGNTSIANGDRLLLPFKNFMMKMGRCTKMKKVNKIASTVLIGFYLRHYIDSITNKIYPGDELELRNVCRFIFTKYSDENINLLISKLKLVKIDLYNALLTEMIIPESFIRHVITKHNLDNEISLLVELNHDRFN